VKPAATDDVDLRILGLLIENGRASYASIGAAVGLSANGAADRVRRLERAGVIRGYRAQVDLESLGRGFDAILDVRLLPAAEPEEFERRAARLPGVREVVFVTGRFDYVLRLACRDAEDLDRTVRAIRTGTGVAQTETRVVMRALRTDRLDPPPGRQAVG
jgi:Lrp/AsnC family leucine-responsive transcriptional regulator